MISAGSETLVRAAERVGDTDEMDHEEMDHIAALAELIDDVWGPEAVGSYLHGYPVSNGLQQTAEADVLDVLVVSRRGLRDAERRALLRGLLALSGTGDGARPPLTLTVVVQDEVRPWRFPPTADFRYSETLREEYEAGEIPSEAPVPALALAITEVLADGSVLTGPAPELVLDPVPHADVIEASVASVARLVAAADGDAHTALPELARIWCTLATGELASKAAAAAWAVERLAPEHRAVLEHARELHLRGRSSSGSSNGAWSGPPRAGVRSCVEALTAEIDRFADAEADEEALYLTRSAPLVANGLRLLERAAVALAPAPALAKEPDPYEVISPVLHLLTAAETLFRGRLAMDWVGDIWSRDDRGWDHNPHTRGEYESLTLHQAAAIADSRCETDIEAGRAALKALEHTRNRALLATDRDSDSPTAVRCRALPVFDLMLAFVETDVLGRLTDDTSFQHARAVRRALRRVRAATARITAAVEERSRAIAPQLAGREEVTVRCPYCGHFAVPADGDEIACRLCGHTYGSAAGQAASDLAPVTPQWHPERCADCGNESVLENTPVAARPDATVDLCLYDGRVLHGRCPGCRGFTAVRSELCRSCAEETANT